MSESSRGFARTAIVVVFVLLLGGGIWWSATNGFFKATVAVPQVSTADMEPQVAEKIQRMRTDVLDAPESASAWGRYAKTLHAHDLLRRAIETYEITVELDPEDYRWPYLAGMAQRKLDPIKSVPWLDQAGLLRPKNPAFYINYGDILLQLGDANRAQNQYDRALGLEAKSVHAYYGLGQVAMLRGDTDTAVGHLRRALAIAPHHGESHTLLAQAYYRLGQEELAKREELLAQAYFITTRAQDPVVRAMESEAVDSQSYARRGVSFANKGEYESAERQFRKVLDYRDGTSQDYANLGGSLGGQRRFDEAIAAYDKSLELESENVDALNNLAITLFRTNELQKAAVNLERAVAINPDHASAHHNLGLVRSRQGEVKEAIEHYRRALEANPTHGEALANLGQALAKLGLQKEAVEIWAQALSINPRNMPARYNLATSFAALGEHGMAIRLLAEGLELSPNSSRMTTMLAWELATAPDAELRNGARAVQLARMTYAAKPDDPQQADLLAAAFAEAGNFADAIAAAERGLQIIAASANSANGLAMQRRLEGYRRGIPFHQQAQRKEKAGEK